MYAPPSNTAVISRQGPSAVTYHIPTTTSNLKTTVVLPKDSNWSSGLHWHKTHTEYLRLIQGCIYVRLGASEMILSAADGAIVLPLQVKTQVINGVVTVERGVRHCWQRATSYYSPQSQHFPSDIDEEVIVEEHTSPADITKPLFFWNLNGAITATPATIQAKTLRWLMGGWYIELQLFIIFWELDNWPVLMQWGGGSGENMVTWLALLLAAIVGKLASIQAVSEERTPRELWKAWQKDRVYEKRKI